MGCQYEISFVLSRPWRYRFNLTAQWGATAAADDSALQVFDRMHQEQPFIYNVTGFCFRRVFADRSRWEAKRQKVLLLIRWNRGEH